MNGRTPSAPQDSSVSPAGQDSVSESCPARRTGESDGAERSICEPDEFRPSESASSAGLSHPGTAKSCGMVKMPAGMTSPPADSQTAQGAADLPGKSANGLLGRPGWTDRDSVSTSDQAASHELSSDEAGASVSHSFAEQPGPHTLIVIGLSGAGKSTVLQVLEDLNFFTADGLPPAMIPEFRSILQRPGMEHFRGMALGVDFRRGGTMQDLSEALGDMRAQGAHPLLLYLEAQPEVILRRYASTRRPHPLEREGLGLEQAMAVERRRLAPIRAAADLVLDTSAFTLHDLRREIQHRWCDVQPHMHAMRVNLVSFGFKYGVPKEADLVFDLRFLPNPYFEEELRPLSGQDQPIVDYIFAEEPARLFRDRFLDFLQFLLPCYDVEGRYRLTIAMGCTGGRHRSVAMTETAAQTLRQAGYPITVEHRHWKLG